MNHHDKTKEELLRDLQDLQQKYDSISLLYETEKYTLAALVENNSDAMLVKDCNRRIIAGNSAFLKATGYKTLAELIGKTDADILNIPENTEPVFSYKQEDLKALQLSAGETIEREEDIPFSAGEWKTFLTKKFPIFIDKKLIGIGVITSDITKIKQAEQRLLNLNDEYASVNEKLIERNTEYQLQSERLKTLNRYYQLVNDYSSDVVAMYDNAFNPVYISPSVKKYIGYEVSEFSEISIFDIVHPEDKQQLFADIERIKNNNIKNYTNTYRIKHKNGHYFWNESVSHVVEEDGQTFTIVNSRNIDDRKKTELEIRESEEKYRLLINNINDLVCKIDENGVYTFVCPNYKEILGYEPEELIGKSVIDFIHPEDLELSQKKYERIKKTSEKSFDIWRFKHKNGEYRIIETKGTVFTNSNNEKRTVAISRDITDQKALEDELKEKTSFLSTLMETSPVGIVTVDKTGSISYANRRAEQILGLVKEEITSITYDAPLWKHTDLDGSSFPDEKQPFNVVKKSLTTVFDIQHGITWPDGRVVILSINAAPIKDNNGKFNGMIASIEDITERKQTERQLKESKHNLLIKNEDLLKAKEKAEESDRLKTEFLNNMSHEIRTPMNGIIGFSAMFDKPDLSEEKRKYYSKIVQNSSHQLLRIIDDILEISTLETKQERLNETEFCLNDLLMELFSVFNLKSKERNIPLYLKKALHDDQSYILSDKTKLNKILSNLLENALKFTSEGFVEFGYNIDKTNLILYVKDTGIGISPKNHEIVFERFSQENKDISHKLGGLGLGLSICKENSLLLGGDITLDSEKGKGSTFYVSLPYKPVQIVDNNTSKSIDDKQKTYDNYTILVAEDEEVNYLYIEVLFEDEIEGNYNLIHAKNGKEAVEICIENNNIDLVLMDIKMPIMNGLEATEKIKEKFPNLQIIAQTAYSTESDKQLALKHGCDDFISKPIHKDKLIGMINKYLIDK